MARNCYGCYFYKPLGNMPSGKRACHYLLETGTPRDCSVEECIRRISRKYVAEHGKWRKSVEDEAHSLEDN